MNEQTANGEQEEGSEAEVEGHRPIIVNRPRPAVSTTQDPSEDDGEVLGHRPIIVSGPRRPLLPTEDDAAEL